MNGRVLHILSQRPSLTGSGVTLDALSREAHRSGWSQRALVGTPASAPIPVISDLDEREVDALLFGEGDLDFPLPGMSDIMPYESSRFSDLSRDQLDGYLQCWRELITRVLDEFKPHVVHSHHVWLVSSLLKDIAPSTPVVTHCHSTGLRQMALCPHLADSVRRGVRRNDLFATLHRAQAAELVDTLRVDGAKARIVGAGYREDIFYFGESSEARDHRAKVLLYAGKLSQAKGLPWLLDAFDAMVATDPECRLHIAGGGAGAEAERLLSRIRSTPNVEYHGRVDQQRLAQLMREAAVFVLPSLYEGLPLVLVEAAACGCRLVSTALPAVEGELAPVLADTLSTVPVPRLKGPDIPAEADLPEFVSNLTMALRRALDSPLLGDPQLEGPEVLDNFTWKAVFQRIESMWTTLIDSR